MVSVQENIVLVVIAGKKLCANIRFQGMVFLLVCKLGARDISMAATQ